MFSWSVVPQLIKANDSINYHFHGSDKNLAASASDAALSAKVSEVVQSWVATKIVILDFKVLDRNIKEMVNLVRYRPQPDILFLKNIDIPFLWRIIEIPEIRKWFGKVRILDLSQSKASQSNIQKLQRILFPHLTNLEAIDFSNLPLNTSGRYALSQASFKKSLRMINLKNTGLDISGLQDLLSKPLLENIEVLDLSDNYIGNTGLTAVVGSYYLKKLKALNISNCGVMASGIYALAHSDKLPALKILDLSDNSLAPLGIANLSSSSSNLDKLEYLDLSNTGMESTGMEHLADAHKLAHLRGLNLSNNSLDDEDIRTFIRSPFFNHLDVLILDGINNLSPSLVSELQRKYPSLSVKKTNKLPKSDYSSS